MPHYIVTQTDGEMYSPVAGLLRDYHNLNWDISKSNTGVFPTPPPYPYQFPFALNGVNWEHHAYKPWTEAGFRNNAAIQFGTGDISTPEARATNSSIQYYDWNDLAADAYNYGYVFADYFKTGGEHPYVDSIQIGNEPTNYTAGEYREVLKHMARGIKAADPNMKVVTAAMSVNSQSIYSKPVELLISQNDNLLDDIDAIAIHTYPHADPNPWPEWERTYPEDTRPNFNYLKHVQDLIDWRNATPGAQNKEIWVTEFGYDSSTRTNPPWVGVTDAQQAQWLTRSYLAFAAMGVDRAYMFWFHDSDSPSVHGSSGLTRGQGETFEYKPSFFALRHLYETLGDYRFGSVILKLDGDLFIYEYESETDPNDIIWAIWSPTGNGREVEMILDGIVGTPLFADRMPLDDGLAQLVDFDLLGSGRIRLMVGESPTYLRIAVPEPGAIALVGIAGAAALLRRRGGKTPG